jgi:Pycsar effector protein
VRAAAIGGRAREALMASYTEIEYMRVLNQTFYDQVKTADQKAGYICTFLTILFAYSKDRGQLLIFLNGPASFSTTWFLSLGFVLAACFAIVCTALVVVPRSKAGGSTLYWGAWVDGAAIEQKLSSGLPDEFIISEYLTNIRNLAAICQIKYKYVGLAFRGAAIAIVCYLMIVMIHR